jgi:hypothetical protein
LDDYCAIVAKDVYIVALQSYIPDDVEDVVTAYHNDYKGDGALEFPLEVKTCGDASDLGGKRQGDHLVVLTRPTTKYPDAASVMAHPAVLWINKQQVLELYSQSARAAHRLTTNTVLPNGQGMTIAIADTGIDVHHCAFYDSETDLPHESQSVLPTQHSKIASLVTAVPGVTDYRGSNGAHGTGVVGAAVGYDCGTTIGMAPGARVAFYDMSPVGTDELVLPLSDGPGVRTFYEYLDEVFTVGQATVFSGSWGAQNGGQYDSLSSEMDGVQYNHPRVSLVFAAGNDGNKANRLPSSPSSCKACNSVGAVFADAQYYESVWDDASERPEAYGQTKVVAFSSFGPLPSGRANPIVYSPGVFEAAPYGYYHPVLGHVTDSLVSGTSYSAPNVAAIIARYQQNYMARHNGVVPYGALATAMLLATSVPVTHRVGLTQQGAGSTLGVFNTSTSYGVPVIEYIGQDKEGIVTTADNRHAFCYVAIEDMSLVKIAMAFTDRKHVPYASTVLVNDLDMDVYVGHSLEHALQDRVNPHERVTIQNVTAGTTLRVVVKEKDGTAMGNAYFGVYVAGRHFAEATDPCSTCEPTTTSPCGDTGTLRYCDVSTGTMTPCVGRVNTEFVDVLSDCRGDTYDGLTVGAQCVPVQCDEGYYYSNGLCRCFEGVYKDNERCANNVFVVMTEEVVVAEESASGRPNGPSWAVRALAIAAVVIAVY